MDMDSMIFDMREQDLERMKKLLAQYQKDLFELKSSIDTAKSTDRERLYKKEKSLEAKIADLMDSIMAFEETYDYAI